MTVSPGTEPCQAPDRILYARPAVLPQHPKSVLAGCNVVVFVSGSGNVSVRTAHMNMRALLKLCEYTADTIEN